MAIDVNVTNGTTLDDSTDGEIIEITFTNTNEILYAAHSKVYYYVLITDSTALDPIEKEVTFSTAEFETEGSLAAGAIKTFVLENTFGLVYPFSGSDGKICYRAR